MSSDHLTTEDLKRVRARLEQNLGVRQEYYYVYHTEEEAALIRRYIPDAILVKAKLEPRQPRKC